MEVKRLSTTVIENKKAVVSEIQGKISAASSAVVVEYRGLSVTEITNLRRQLRAEGIEFKVYKNTMLRRAVEAEGHNDLLEALVGPNAIAFSDDAVAPSRVLAGFAKKHKKLILKAGLVDGKVVDADELKELSSLPNHDGMISMLLGMFQSPIRSFAYAVDQVAQKRAEAGDVVETPEVVEEATTEEVVEEVATEEVAEEVAAEADAE
jgi:large subunit ribosomal protein L10